MKRRIIAAVLLIMTMAVMLSGCSSLPGEFVKKLSGRYVNQLNDKDYFEFKSGGKVKYHHNGEKFDGTYRISDGVVFGVIETYGKEIDTGGKHPDGYLEYAVNMRDSMQGENGTLLILQIENKKTLTFGVYVYARSTFWSRNWWKLLIGFVVLCIIVAIYEKTTGKDFEEEAYKLSDRIDNFFDGDDNDDNDASDFKDKKD